MSDAPITSRSRWSRFLDDLRAPIFAEVLRHRAISILLAALAMGQLATAFLRVTVIVCPFARSTGLPCPGCGLTRATAYFAAGHFQQSMSQHVFAPVVLLGLVLLTFASVAPAGVRDRLAVGVEAVERRTGIMPLLFALLMLYWVVRLIFAPHAALAEFHL